MHIFNILDLIEIVGLIGVIAIIFTESGLFFGFFLPGDSLLFTAGFLSSTGVLPFWPLMIGTILAAISAGFIGYWFGNFVGHKLFDRPDTFFFRKKHLIQTKAFFEKYGTKTIVLCRFVPIVRTFAPIFAGIGQMNFQKFAVWNIIGGIIWPGIIVTAGYYLGRLIPGIEDYMLPAVLVIVILSAIPIIWEWYMNRKKVS